MTKSQFHKSNTHKQDVVACPLRRIDCSRHLRPLIFDLGFLCFLLLLAVIVFPVYAEPRDMLGEAIAEYQGALNEPDGELRTERFQRARRRFTQVLNDESVKNAQLYTNLANAALQSEDLGESILAYRRALAIEPGHGQARQNLDYARALLPGWVTRPGGDTLLDTFFFWHQVLSQSCRDLIGSVAFAVAGLLFAIAVRWRRNWARNIGILVGVVWVALMTLSMWDRWSVGDEEVVVTVPQVIARAADSIGAPARFAEPLPAGTEAGVLERRDDWLRIRLANHHDAWVRASAVTFVVPGPGG